MIRLLKVGLLLVICLFSTALSHAEKNWTARWITTQGVKNEANTWMCFRKGVNILKVPDKLIASIAVDSKYWLWVNGKKVVFEGGLKRGPSPEDTYYDEVNLTPYLKKGHNTIAVLVWYFGKEGFSHKSSGMAGLVFDCHSDGLLLNSNETWKATVHPSFLPFEGVQPNVRLPESSLCFDARKDIGDWMSEKFDDFSWKSAEVLGTPPCKPWNRLVLRPVPQWKNYGLKEYENKSEIPAFSNGEPIVCKLPANLQVTPWLQVEAADGQVIDIRTDHFNGGGEPNVQARYITKKGLQEYENMGWMNGEQVIYSIPKGVKIVGLKYRETGFDTEFSGSFTCSDDFFNNLWKKSRRTLYVTMRDNYMDCPDRERAQWWGDEVIESGEAFYAFDCRSHSLQKKGMMELINWQKPDSTLFAPVPAGNWDKELPGQMLASVGYFGFWNYYMQTGDIQTIAELYDGVMRYLAVWKVNSDGILITRQGGWYWGDWGEQKDMELLQNAWYYLALKGAYNMAQALQKNDDAIRLQHQMEKFKAAFNKQFWTGDAYRYPTYTGKTDDRAQALAVVSGLADASNYPALFKLFTTNEFASPYMEKYVIEALFMMGKDQYALERLNKRFGPMVNDPEHSTLWEVWGNSSDGFTGGTTNHAWSGGGLTLLSQYVCGIAPIEPGYKKFQIAPQPGGLTSASARVTGVKGVIEAAFSNQATNFELSVTVPKNTSAVVKLPSMKFVEIKLNGKTVWENGIMMKRQGGKLISLTTEKGQAEIGAGKWEIKAIK
jgi:hypothetical protein